MVAVSPEYQRLRLRLMTRAMMPVRTRLPTIEIGIRKTTFKTSRMTTNSTRPPNRDLTLLTVSPPGRTEVQQPGRACTLSIHER